MVYFYLFSIAHWRAESEGNITGYCISCVGKDFCVSKCAASPNGNIHCTRTDIYYTHSKLSLVFSNYRIA